MTDEEVENDTGPEIAAPDGGDWVTPLPPTGTPAFAVMPWPLFLRLRDLASHAVNGTQAADDIEIRGIADTSMLAALNQHSPFDDTDPDALSGDDEFGEKEDIPLALLDRLLDGEHPLKVFRRYRGLSQKELAKRTGLNATYLSQIETRKRGGSRRVYRLLAVALNVDIGDLIE